VIEAEIGKVINEMEIEIDPAEATEEIDKDSYAVTCMVRVVHEVFWQYPKLPESERCKKQPLWIQNSCAIY